MRAKKEQTQIKKEKCDKISSLIFKQNLCENGIANKVYFMNCELNYIGIVQSTF